MEGTDALLRELTTIRWLLAAIGVGMLVIVTTFVVLAVNMLAMMKESRRNFGSQSREAELEDLLASGQSRAARLTATEWVTAEPGRPAAHWALAKAHFQLGELAEAKQVLKGLLKIAPEEHYRVDAWLDLLEDEFAQHRPKSVE